MREPRPDLEYSAPDEEWRRRLEQAVGDYIERVIRGEKIDPLEVFETHPELAADILRELDTFASIECVSAASVADTSLGTLGDYTLRRRIGRGGMGIVYEAWENSMDRAVALKVLPAGVAADDRTFQRFMQEAKTAGRLSHQNIVPVYSTGIKEGTPWFSMEFVEGETVAQILARIKNAEPETETPFGKKDDARYFHNLADAFADVGDGLQHAHSKGVTHRDIKPSNLILDAEGRLRILDFGLARLEGQESLTLSGDFVGTPLYMSPEQARRKKIPVDHRTDVYSLGATVYEALCGRPPFRGKDHADTLSQIIEWDPVEPRKINPPVPKDLETIVLKCLRKDAGDRYGTAEALAQDLRRFVRGDPIEARPAGRWERVLRRARRHCFRLLSGAAIVLIALLAAGLLYRLRSEEAARRTRDYDRSLVAAAMRVYRGELILSEGPVTRSRWSFFLPGIYRAVLTEAATSALETAHRDLTRIAGILPDRFEAWYYRARCLWLLDRDDEARGDVVQCLRRAPRFGPARLLLALMDGEINREIERMEKGAGDPASRPGAVDELGSAWARAFEAERRISRSGWLEAADAYTELIHSHHRERTHQVFDLETRLRRGQAFLRAKRFHEAILDFQAVRALAEDRWDAFLEPLLLLARAFYETDAVDVAENLLDEARRLPIPEGDVSPWVAGTYAMLVELSHPDPAVDLARKVVEAQPSEARAHVILARSLLGACWLEQPSQPRGEESTGSPLEAELSAVIDRALRLDHEDPAVLSVASKWLQWRGRSSEALTTALKAFARVDSVEISGVSSSPGRRPAEAGDNKRWNGEASELGWFEVRGPVPGIGVNSPFFEFGIGLAGWESRLYFGSVRPGGLGDHDIYSAVWDEELRRFVVEAPLTHLNSPYWDNAPSVTRDGGTLVLHTNGDEHGGFVSRHFASASWSEERKRFGKPVSWTEFRPIPEAGLMGPVSISHDGLELVWSCKPVSGNAGDQDLWIAWRRATDEPFSIDQARALDEINSPFDEFAPTFSSDRSTVLWTGFFTDSHAGAFRPEGSRLSIWMASRESVAGEPDRFGEIRKVRLDVDIPVLYVRVSEDWPREGSKAYFIVCLPFDEVDGLLGSDGDIWYAVWHRGEE